MNWLSWSESIKRIHNPVETGDVEKNSLYYERLAYDEIFSNLLIFNEIKKKNRKNKKNTKKNINARIGNNNPSNSVQPYL